MEKRDIAEVLEEMGLILEIKGENPFKVRAYGNAARTLEGLEEDLGAIIEEGRLGDVPGIGKAMIEKITQLFEEDRLPLYDELKASIPAGLLELTEIAGLGPKKIKALHEELGVDGIASLEKAIDDGKVAELPGFGKKTAEKLKTGIANRAAYSARHIWWDANETAQLILQKLKDRPEVTFAEAAGSLRRGKETVGDLDFLAASNDPDATMTWFVGVEHVQEVTAHGKTKSSVRFEGGLQADLRVVPEEQFFFALHHFTGSKEHNVAMRSRALKRGYSLSEWGLTPTEASNQPTIGPVRSESDLFRELGLYFIPPELREDRGEIEAAEAGELPEMVQLDDLRGTFHCHTTASDGHNSLTEMANAAADFGWEYFGIADHSKSSFQANGLSEERLTEQIEKIRAYNESREARIHLFAGNEVDILKDGSLDFDDGLLSQLDYVVASVHSVFNLTEEEMTARLIKAIEHPATTMLGHISGRLLLRREAYAVDTAKVIDAAIANDTIIEINASPWRLELDWRHLKSAADKGLKLAINPDAHDTAGLQYVRNGILIARKGWLQKEHIFNTLPLARVKKALAKS